VTVNYYEHHIGDFLKDTISLSMAQEGAYRRLIDVAYSQEKPLPADLDECYRLARAMSKSERDAVQLVLGRYFTKGPDGYRQKRIDEEIEKAQDRINTARENGKAGGRPKKNPAGSGKETKQEPSGFPVGSDSGTQTITETKATTSHSPPPTFPEEGSLRSPLGAREDWESHRQWALDELRSVYPSNLFPDADWEIAARTIAGRIVGGETTRENLHTLTLQFAAQQDAKGNRDTQYMEGPVRHFDGRGRWRGPFNLPAAASKPREETAMERIQRKNSNAGPRVLDGEVLRG
jgi:uncharacterized protein YdaU (DUF1376 family)